MTEVNPSLFWPMVIAKLNSLIIKKQEEYNQDIRILSNVYIFSYNMKNNASFAIYIKLIVMGGFTKLVARIKFIRNFLL